MIDPYLTFATVVVPIIMSRLIRYCQLENRCFRRVSGIGIFNIGAQANNHSIDEMKGFSRPVRTVILIMLMQFHSKIAVFSLL